jgi:trehalose 6-phosphate synthase/phosphatase
MLPLFTAFAAAGFHTFDYARHFLSCCSRMLGLEHETSRGSISLDYYGRTVGIKIMPTGTRGDWVEAGEGRVEVPVATLSV